MPFAPLILKPSPTLKMSTLSGLVSTATGAATGGASAAQNAAQNAANSAAQTAQNLAAQGQGYVDAASSLANTDPSQLADVASQAAYQAGSDALQSAIVQNMPAAAQLLASYAVTVGKDAATGAAIGAIAGSWFPGVGTAVGGVVGGWVGAAVGVISDVMSFLGRKSGPPEFFDDPAWDKETGSSSEGKETRDQGFVTESSYGISGTQLKMVRAVALIITSLGPSWKTVWPSLWHQIADKNGGILPNGQPTQFYAMLVKASGSPGGVNSPLLANSVARFLGAPQNGVAFPASALAPPKQNNGVAPLPPSARAALAGGGAIAKALPGLINPATGLAYANNGTTGPSGPPSTTMSQMNLSGINFNAFPGLGMPIYPGQSLPPGTKIADPDTIPSIPLATLLDAAAQSQKTGISVPIPIPSVHAVVASAGAGNPASVTWVLNTVSAARSPTATPAQTQLADTVALAHKIQTHAKYVQKWQGPAAAQALLAGHYLTTANLG